MSRRRLCAALLLTGRPADEVEGLRRALGSAEIGRIAPHLTLVPPLNVPEAGLEAATQLLVSSAERSRPISVTLGPAATFWPSAPVCYLEVSGDLEALAALRRHLTGDAGPLAPPPGRPGRGFVPHVTINQQIDPGRIPAALETLAAYRLPTAFERVTLLELVEAERRWVPLADSVLGPAAVYGTGGLALRISAGSRLEPAAAAWAALAWEQYSIERYGPGTAAAEPLALVARISGELVGVAEAELCPHLCRLASLIVAPQWRSHGVGSHLLAETERRALSHRAGRVRLETLAGGREEGFYRERGYEVVALLPKWRSERDFVVMERVVTA